MRTTAYLKAITEVSGKIVTGLGLYLFELQPRNKQVSKEVVHELEFGGIAVMQT